MLSLKELLNILINQKIYQWVFSLIIIVLLNIVPSIKIVYAGGGRAPCSDVEYNEYCFSIKNNSYLIPSFIYKDKKDNRYAAERKWDVILDEHFKINLNNSYYNAQDDLKSKNKKIELKLEKIRKKNIFLRTFFKTYKYENYWCNDKIEKALKYSTEIAKHLPNNEITQRLTAGRIVMAGNYCFQNRQS